MPISALQQSPIGGAGGVPRKKKKSEEKNLPLGPKKFSWSQNNNAPHAYEGQQPHSTGRLANDGTRAGDAGGLGG